ncbi:MAG: glucuronate isomerase [Eubacteriales bacterium]|nr:glucuronate isomerase [Eubacteriales bacterium]
MKKFMDENFLLNTNTAEVLYHRYAKDLPIYDYHCHLNPKEIYENKPYENITQMWLAGDHYKWRLMRQNGVDEKYITGDADDYEKFEKFVECVQYAAGNPIYHWCHLELQRYFGVYEVLTAENTKLIWDRCAQKKYTPQKLIEMSNVKLVCTTDDPLDTLEYHQKLKDSPTKILPTFRPDKIINIDKPGFLEYLNLCGGLKTLGEIEEFISDRLKFFYDNGCRISDHSLDYVPFEKGASPEAALEKALKGEPASKAEADSYKTHLLLHCAKLYKKYNITMQIHYGAMRNNNTHMFNRLGPDTGFDSIGESLSAHNLSRLIDSMSEDAENSNPKIILYSLNPNDFYMLATMTGNFRNIQFGSAWWFNDQLDGMTSQMKALANLGALNKFVGMLTDSRSFLSYPRHEYFRRILCRILGEWADEGLFPADLSILGKIVSDICYYNAVDFFGILL